ncbi:MAG TPA: response regulator [Acidimicrobiales bacterium]|nr:response regulator [Acidimicrobiales bacterium]
MIVDDEDGVRSLVKMTLDGAGYQIIEASNGTDALELARAHHPDLMLLDVMMPDLSGIEVCRALKNEVDTAGITIVMLTAKAQHADVGEAEEAGADGYFTKPFSPIALVRRVEAILGAVR